MLSRHRIHGFTVAAVACAMAGWPARAHAQSEYAREDHPALVFYAQAGVFSPLAHLDDEDYVEFQGGFSVGGGTAYRLNRYVALRGNFTFTRAEVRDASTRPLSPISSDMFNRYLYDGDVQLRYPLHDRVTPYAFLGGGGITVQRDVARDRSRFTRGMGKVGLGLSYQLPESGLAVFAEGTGWMYRWDRYGFDNMQFDITISAGLAYRFGL